MAGPSNQVFIPAGFQELFTFWNHFPGAVICAGGAGIIRGQGRHIPILPKYIISLDRIDDLNRIRRTERYLEIGAMVKLNQIINLGKIVPEALMRCLDNIAGPQIRSQISIGGNLCSSSIRLDIHAPMVALDAQYELRTAQSTRWIAASRFSPPRGPIALAPQELLTRIRVPLEPWNFCKYKKFHGAGSNEPDGAVVFIIRNEKNILTEIRTVYSGQIILREKSGENKLAGRRLPLEARDAAAFVESWRNLLSNQEAVSDAKAPPEDGGTQAPGSSSPPGLKNAQILNFIETAIMEISD